MAAPTSEKLLHTFGVPYRGVWRQRQAHELPEDALWNATNVVVRDAGLQPRDGLAVFDADGTPFTGIPTGLSVYVSTGGTVIPILGTRQELYKYDAGTWTEITGAVNLTASNDQLARFTSLVIDTTNYIVHANGADLPRRWNGTGNFAGMTGTPPTWSDVATIADRLIGIVPPYLVRWGNARSITVFPALNTKQMAETPDRVVSIQSMGQVAGIIWKTGSLWTVSPTGNLSDAQSFRFDLVGFYEGPASPAAVVDVNGIKMHMTPTGRVGVYNGSRVQWIADGVWPLIRADIRRTQTKRIFGWFDPDQDEVHFIYPTQQEASGVSMKGRLTITLPKPEAGVSVYGAWPGLSAIELRAGNSVHWADNTRDTLLFSVAGESLKVSGSTDLGTTIGGSWQTGLIQAPQGDPVRIEGLELFAERGAGHGVLMMTPMSSFTLSDDDGVPGDAVAIDLELAEPTRAVRGVDTRARFLGFQFEFDSAVTTPLRYKGAALYGQKRVA